MTQDQAHLPQVRLLTFTSHHTDDYIMQALNAGTYRCLPTHRATHV